MHPCPSSSARRGFSLIELMVVITIIAILSSIVIPAGHAIQKNMKKVEAQKTCTEIRTALMSYLSEYKKFPSINPGGGELEIPTDSTNALVATLIGQDPTFNRRGIQFYSAKPAKKQGMQGLWQVGGTSFELLDPFGAGSNGSSLPYYVMFDSNYDNSLTVPARSGNGTEQIFTNVAVWCLGADGALGSSGSSSDDVFAY